MTSQLIHSDIDQIIKKNLQSKVYSPVYLNNSNINRNDQLILKDLRGDDGKLDIEDGISSSEDESEFKIPIKPANDNISIEEWISLNGVETNSSNKSKSTRKLPSFEDNKLIADENEDFERLKNADIMMAIEKCLLMYIIEQRNRAREIIRDYFKKKIFIRDFKNYCLIRKIEDDRQKYAGFIQKNYRLHLKMKNFQSKTSIFTNITGEEINTTAEIDIE